jgi:hypothetical protein
MKKIVLIFIVVFSFFFAKAQDGELGPIVGASFYIGEINQSKVFYMPSLVYGVVFRHNFHQRFSLRIEGTHTNLKANDANSQSEYQIERNYSFNTKLTDLAAGIEFNFLPYDKSDQNSKYFTPYIFAGASFLVVPENEDPFTFAFPFGFGFKYAVSKKISFGAEWTIRKTFTDFIDKIDDDYITSVRTTYENKQRSYNRNNDWFSYAGAVVTIQIFESENACPAYNQ